MLLTFISTGGESARSLASNPTKGEKLPNLNSISSICTGVAIPV